MSTALLLVLDILVAAFLVLYVLPELWARLRLRRPVKAIGIVADFLEHGTPLVALTFDDGPDPETTPPVLEALDDLDVKATFFMVGERVAAHSEVARLVAEKGHMIASHGYRHRHHWLLSPPAIQRDISSARDGLASQGLVPDSGLFYRPPWGTVTLATLRAVRHAEMMLALYDVESGDWLRRGPDDIAGRVVRNVRPQSVVLFHDAAGEAGQVEDMVRALRKIVPLLREQGYRFTTMFIPPPGRRQRLLLRAWMAWERLFARMAGVLPLTESIHLAPCAYHGPPRLLDGREVLKSGDRCMEIHFNSELLYQIPGDATARLGGFWRRMNDDMARVAQIMVSDPRFAEVKALTAITLFHGPARRVGFHSEPVEPPWRRRFFTWYMGLIKRIYQGAAVSDTAREVRFMWITRDEFINRNLGKAE